ncbi:hypothetical protein C5E44_29400 [Nocardia nova]|uniref:HAD family hydrolase n=1 Tax=Nocardia nova TaxID=37330 RepID=UPI000CEA074E|nr:hypothetical protein C5E44_29400 [Nocardia nova]
MSRLAAVLASKNLLLLDFDGPICSVFSGLSNREAARRLARQLDDHVPRELLDTDDPFDVLHFATSIDAEVGQRIEHEFAEIEVEAIATAAPTPGATDVIGQASVSGYTVAIVSNNSVAAIDAYLTQHHLKPCVQGVFARTSFDVSKLKPSPYLLDVALASLGATRKQAVFVGDSTTDLEAARSAAISSIAFANRTEKVARFARYPAVAVITSMTDLSEALQAAQ